MHEHVHCVDDFSRLACPEVLNQKTTTAIGFVRRAGAFYRWHAIGSGGA